MSTKTKRLSQLLFRRSSTNSGSNKPEFIAGRNNKIPSNSSAKEESIEGNHSNAFLIPQIVETTPKSVSHVIFCEKPDILRSRSSSPNRRRNPDLKPTSILKNGNSQSRLVENNSTNGKLTNGKTTLQRTKSNPNPSSANGPYSSSLSSNPLQDVSWNCPTLEKRKDMILNYFKHIVLDQNSSKVNTTTGESEPIYEEIGSPRIMEKTINSSNSRPNENNSNTDSLKPKIAPKRFRLNIPVTSPCDEKPPIYDKLLTRSSSFNVYEDLQQLNSNRGQMLQKMQPGASEDPHDNHAGAATVDPNLPKNNNNNIMTEKKSLKNSTIGLAHFASEVAKHAKANRSNSFNMSSSSSSSNSSSSSSSCSSSHYDSACDVDLIYARIDKRCKKVGTPTTRLLKKHQNQLQIQQLPHSGQLNQKRQSAIQKIEQIRTSQEKLISPIALNTNTINNNNDNNNKRTISNSVRTINNNFEQVEGGGNESCCTESSNNTSRSSDGGLSEVPLVTSDSSCYSSSSEESESLQKNQQPLRPPRANKIINSPNTVSTTTTTTSTTLSSSNNNIFIVATHKVDKILPEKDLKEFDDKNKNKSKNQQQQSGFIDLADVFPPISPTTSRFPIGVSVIDSRTSSPTSYPLNKPQTSDIIIQQNHHREIHFDNQNKKQQVSVIHQKVNQQQEPQKPFSNYNFSSCSSSSEEIAEQLETEDNPHTPKLLLYIQNSGTDNLLFHQEEKIFDVKNQKSSQEQTQQRNHQNHLKMDMDTTVAQAAKTSVLTTPQDEGTNSTTNLLIETKDFWEVDLALASTTSPAHSQQSEETEDSSGTSTTSDLSDSSSSAELAITMSQSVKTMEDYNKNHTTSVDERNQFIRQDPKYYEDVDEDGGFESFQVVDDPNLYDEDYNNDDEPFSPPSSSGSPDIITTSNRQRTFAQAQQNIPEKELTQKASSVLDLINAEISDLHLRELELKRKNRIADDNESEDMVEGSQADSDDFSDSAVDIDSCSPTSNRSGSGSLTPADGRKLRDSPHSDHGSDSASDNENKDFEDEKLAKSATTDGLAEINSTKTTSSLIVEDEPGSAINKQQQQQQQGVKVRPIVEAEQEVKSIELCVTKETPIEREIRLVREREDEFRRHRSLSSVDVDDQQQPSPKSTPKQQQFQKLERDAVPVPVLSNSNNNSIEAKLTQLHAVNSSSSGTKDIQYEMATARLKREIEESLMRERELYREGRLKTISVSESVDESGSEKSEELKSDEDEQEIIAKSDNHEEDRNILPSSGKKVHIKLPLVAKQSSEEELLNGKSTSSSTPSSAGSNAVRFFSPAAYTGNQSRPESMVVTSVTSPTTVPQSFNFQSSPQSTASLNNNSQSGFQMPPNPNQTQSLPMNIAKPQFTSIERMILKGSFSFNKSTMNEDPVRVQEEVRMAKISRMPDPLQIVHRVESIEETEERENVQESKPLRRKYVPAQDKIQKELQEQVKREKELSQLRAKWKSTPDLSKSDEPSEMGGTMDNESKILEGENLTKPSALRRQMSSSSQKISEEVSTSDVLRMNKPTVRRRQSALINQWEEMIKQQQQKNKN